MRIIAVALSGLVLLIAGYSYVVSYFNPGKLSDEIKNGLKLSKNRVLYLGVGAVLIATVICLLELQYHRRFHEQLKLISLICILLPAAAVDYRVNKIPNKLVLAGLVMRFLLFGLEALRDTQNLWAVAKDALFGGLVIGGFFFLLLLVFRNSLGMGDVKLFALIGLYQGVWGAVNAVFFSLLVSFFVSIYLLISKRKKRKDTIPFCPSILLGTFMAICLSGM